MQASTLTVAFDGLDAQPVTVECALTPGLPAFSIVGLPSKAVSEAKDRVRAALEAISVAFPAKRVTINLSPADLPKAGAHFDLPIALCLMAAIGVIPPESVKKIVSLGELSLDGRLVKVAGALPAAVAAAAQSAALICPAACGPEAAWVGATDVVAAHSLGDILQHLSGARPIDPARPGTAPAPKTYRDLRDVRGQDRAKRALEIAAAGRHHLLLVGPPGAGKSMLAARLPGLMPDLSPQEALETSIVHSIAGMVDDGGISRERPYRDPHHTASVAAIVGGGRNASPGEVTLAHNGVLFMDEFPEYGRQVLETLRQPLETGEVTVARANAHVRYPCRFLLLAAANPCRCGHLFDADRACGRAPLCAEDYLSKISGPLLDRFDLRLEVSAVQPEDLKGPATGEDSATVAARISQARARQFDRFADHTEITVNADCEGEMLLQFARPDADGEALLDQAARKFALSARGYHRILRVARTIADLAGRDQVTRADIAEALAYRLISLPGS